jgi:hypothetical protein
MAKIADGTLNDWQDGETIKAADYVQEREIIRVAVNDNDGRLGTLETEFNGINLGTAQLQKITADDGNSKISIKDTTENLKDVLVDSAGVGFHTFYASSVSQGLPSSYSLRGWANITKAIPPYSGILYGMDTNGDVWVTKLLPDGWDNWFKLVNQDALDQFKTDNLMTQKTLWSSTDGVYMNGSQTVTPSKKLSDCKNGWTLVFSDYDPTTKKTNDFDFNYYNIPKYHSAYFSGKSVFAPIVSYLSDKEVKITTKRLYVYDNKITGSDDNSVDLTTTNDVVLRAVLEY